MTVPVSGRIRGFFEPISLGLYAPTDPSELARYVDDLSAMDSGTLIHELTHYLQFYGSAFGLAYLTSVRGMAAALSVAMTAKASDFNLQFPACDWPIDLQSVFPTDSDKEFYTQAILLNRYFTEELYGLTYSHFGRNQPIADGAKPLVSSPLHLDQSDGTAFAVTGEVLLENHACLNEVAFLNRFTAEQRRDRVIRAAYLDLPPLLQAKYCGFSVWLATLGVIHLEPIIYFILLNQPQFDFLNRLGEYTFVRNAKRILTYAHRYRDIALPQRKPDLVSAVDAICTATDLVNPFKVLEQLDSLLAKDPSPIEDTWPLDWVAQRILGWTLANRALAILWPLDPSILFTSIPILNLRFRNSTDSAVHHRLNTHGSVENALLVSIVRRFHEYVEDVQVIVGLYNRPRVRCPLWWKEKPTACSSCARCSSFLPDPSIGEDCPVAQRHKWLGLTREPKQEDRNEPDSDDSSRPR